MAIRPAQILNLVDRMPKKALVPMVLILIAASCTACGLTSVHLEGVLDIETGGQSDPLATEDEESTDDQSADEVAPR